MMRLSLTLLLFVFGSCASNTTVNTSDAANDSAVHDTSLVDANVTADATSSITFDQFLPVYDILMTSCGENGACHFRPETGSVLTRASSRLSFLTPELAYKMVNRPTLIMNCNIANVVPGNPEESLLIQKVTGTQSSFCGNRMPAPSANPALPDLTPSQVAVIRTWIQNGAQP